ncbi:MAG: transketolase [Clostridia bacterium]
MVSTEALQALACRIRIGAVEEFKARGFGHVGGSLSICDLLAVLYGDVMRYRPAQPDWPDRDKLICSKGHAGPAIYSVLGIEGFFAYDDIKTLNQPGTNFPSHCDRNKTPGIDMTTGSLGQGTSLAVGMAMGDQLRGRDSKVFLIVGDGELNEGQVWEAAMFASAHDLSNMIWFVDDNKRQLDGYCKDVLNPFDIPKKFEAFGFHTQFIPGNDVDAIRGAIAKCEEAPGHPHAIILDSVKGAGIQAVVDTVSNHSMNVSPETCDGWLKELRAELTTLEGRCGA